MLTYKRVSKYVSGNDVFKYVFKYPRALQILMLLFLDE